MPQNPENVVNPGTVNVVTEGFGTGPISPNQPVTVGTSTNPGPLSQAGSFAPGAGLDTPDQPVTVSPPQNSGGLVQGGAASQVSSHVVTTTQNNVAGQVYGTGTPSNVFV